ERTAETRQGGDLGRGVAGDLDSEWLQHWPQQAAPGGDAIVDDEPLAVRLRSARGGLQGVNDVVDIGVVARPGALRDPAEPALPRQVHRQGGIGPAVGAVDTGRVDDDDPGRAGGLGAFEAPALHDGLALAVY